MKEEETNWLNELIKRQALPEEVREGTNTEFCAKWGISESAYYYQASKQENQQEIVKLALNNAKRYAPEVLENLGVRAKSNDKAAEMYLKFILQLAEKTDITTGGKPIPIYGGLSGQNNDNKTTSTGE